MTRILLLILASGCGQYCELQDGACYTPDLLGAESVHTISSAVEAEVNSSYQMEMDMAWLAEDRGLEVRWVSHKEARQYCHRDGCIDEYDVITISVDTQLEAVLAHELLHFAALHAVCITYPWHCPGGAWSANYNHVVDHMFGKLGDTVERRVLDRIAQ